MVKGLGERLQKQRLKRGLSQKQVSITIGVSPGNVSNYESGERTPSLEKLIALADLYHCSTDYLLGLETVENAGLDISMLSEEQQQYLQIFLCSINT